MKKIYLDYNSTTPVDERVFEAMVPYLKGTFGNPSNIHQFGQEAKKGIEIAREQVARFIGAAPEEIFFTSGGTEANNWVLKGTAAALRARGKHIITSPIEHSSVVETAHLLEKEGLKVDYAPVDEYGTVDLNFIKGTVNDGTILVSVMHSNNEVGTIQPIEEIVKIARQYSAVCHTDAVASASKVSVDVAALGVDLLTISSHKLHGPKGVGALYIKKGTKISPILHGGHHEKGMRAGTENLPGIVGFGKACELLHPTWKEEAAAMLKMRDYLEQKIFERIPAVRRNGHPQKRLPNTLNISIGYIEGESLLLALDLEGIAVSSGSACSAGAAEPSHVLKAMRVPSEFINSPLRFSLGRENTKEEIDFVVDSLVQTAERLRKLSPVWKENAVHSSGH
jgi:cysteine desulfurase